MTEKTSIFGKLETEELLGDKEHIQFAVRSVRCRKAEVIFKKGSRFFPEGEIDVVDIDTEDIVREGYVIFVEDFEKEILPKIDLWVRMQESKIQSYERAMFEKFIDLMRDNRRIRGIVKDAISNMEFTEKQTGSAR